MPIDIQSLSTYDASIEFRTDSYFVVLTSSAVIGEQLEDLDGTDGLRVNWLPSSKEVSVFCPTYDSIHLAERIALELESQGFRIRRRTKDYQLVQSFILV